MGAKQPSWTAVLQHMRDRHPVVPAAAWAAADEAIGFTGTGSGPGFQAALERAGDSYMLFIHQATHALAACTHSLEEVPLVFPGDDARHPRAPRHPDH